jgi:aryl-alcohol dehydrogenase-like predicted oxidoreductase
MSNRSPATSSDVPSVDASRLKATETGTARYRDRFQTEFVADYFRPLASGLTVSSIGIGTYLGDSTDDDDRAYESAIQAAVGSGINLIDTAINYRSQRSERTVGAAIQQLFATGNTTREELVVCTKGGYIPLDRTPPATREEYRDYVRREFVDTEILLPDDIVGGGHCLAPRFLRYCLAKSRQNLGLRTIDIYYIHNPGQQLVAVSPAELLGRLRAVFEVLEEAAGRGEIGMYGIATWDSLRQPPGSTDHIDLADLVDIARSIGGADHRFRAVQLPISMAMPEAIRGQTQRVNGKLVSVIEAAEALELSLVGSASLMQGKLATRLPEAVRSLFSGLDTDAQRALAFARSAPGVASALVGMKRPEHVLENLGTARISRS